MQVTFTTALIPALAAPVPLVGSGATVQVGGFPVCLKGDEMPPPLQMPMAYTAPGFPLPGMGQVTVILHPDNLSTRCIQGRPILLKGSTFDALFTVMMPATLATPAGPVPDPVVAKQGTCQFIGFNTNVQAG